MASKSLLGICQTLAQEIGLPVPTTVQGTVSQQVTQMVAFANQVGDFLRDEFVWPVLRKLSTITTVSGTNDYSTDPGGGYTCNRIVNETGWDETNFWFFCGSIGDDEWNEWKYGILTMPLRKIWRTTDDNAIEIFPDVTVNGDVLKLSVVANEWATTSGGAAPKTSMSLDDDVHLFNDRLFLVGTRMRFLAAKGLPYGIVAEEWDSLLPKRKAASRPARTLSLDSRGTLGRHFIDYRNVPDTGFG